MGVSPEVLVIEIENEIEGRDNILFTTIEQ